MKVLITGASGFIGQATVRELQQRGHQVFTLHRGPALAHLAVEHVTADVRSPQARAAASRAEAIVHLAGLGNVDDSFQRPLEYN